MAMVIPTQAATPRPSPSLMCDVAFGIGMHVAAAAAMLHTMWQPQRGNWCNVD